MSTNEEIETRLRRAVAMTPSEDGLRWLDQRVAQVLARPAATDRRGLPTRRMFLRPLALVAAFVVLTGTVVGAMSLLDRTVESSGNPGLQTAWDRAEVLGIKETDAGLTLTLERAYADLNQVVVGFTVEGLEAAPVLSVEDRAKIFWVAELRDPTGRRDYDFAPSSSGTAAVESTLSAVIQIWLGAVPPVAGTWELTVTSVGYNSGGMTSGECTVGATDPECVSPPANAMIDGTWRFEFELPKPTGTVVSAGVGDTAGQATVTLSELRVSPTMITARIALRVADSAVVEWHWLNGSVRHGGTAYTFNSDYHVTQDPHDQGPNGDVNEYRTSAGSDEAAGTWEIEIPELSYVSGEGGPEEIHLAGPWTLTVTVP